MNFHIPTGGFRKVIFFLPFLVLAADVLLYGKGVAWIRSGLTDPASGVVWLILAGYFLYVLALPLSGILHPLAAVRAAGQPPEFTGSGPEKKKTTLSEVFCLYLGAGFGVLVVLLLVHAIGLADGGQSRWTDGQQQGVIYSGSLLVILHISFLAWKPRPRVYADRPAYLVIKLLTLLIGSLAVWVSVAGWLHLLGETAPVTREGGRVLDMVFAYPIFVLFFAYPIFVLFFAGPRFLFLRGAFSRYALVAALILTGVYVWESLEYVKIF